MVDAAVPIMGRLEKLVDIAVLCNVAGDEFDARVLLDELCSCCVIHVAEDHFRVLLREQSYNRSTYARCSSCELVRL